MMILTNVDQRTRHKVGGEWNGDVVDFSDKEDVKKYFEAWIVGTNNGYLVGVMDEIFEKVYVEAFREGMSERSHQFKDLLEIDDINNEGRE